MNADYRTIKEINICDIEDISEEDLVKYPNNLQLLFYSCLLYEMKMHCEDGLLNQEEQERILREENRCYSKYYEMLEEARRLGTREWPKEISMECTTVCNAKCRNCTHETLIKRGDRKLAEISLDEAYYRIKKIRLLTLLFAKEEPRFLPVGLGEPLCHPHIIDIVKYAKKFFPRIQVTTNGRLLTQAMADKLLDAEVEIIQYSLCYYDPQVYQREIGMDQAKTYDNLIKLFKNRNDRKSSTRIDTFIFDNKYNTIDNRKNFLKQFDGLKQKGDFVTVRDYERIVENEIEGSAIIRNTDRLTPCYQLWGELLVDVEGHIFPCCLGGWKKYDSLLSIGYISDKLSDVINNLDTIRKNHEKGKYGSCINCHVLRTVPVESDDGRRYADLERFCGRYKRIHLYGAGTVGRRIKNVLKNGGIVVTDYIVSEDCGETEFEGSPLISVDRIQFDEDDGFVTCIREELSEQLLRKLVEKGVNKDNVFVQKLFYPLNGINGEVVNRELSGV